MYSKDFNLQDNVITVCLRSMNTEHIPNKVF